MKTRTESTLADVLREAVRANGSISSVAEKAGIPQPVLSRFMSGQRDLTLRTADKLARCLGLALQPVR